MAYAVSMPHQQARRDALGCDSLCWGSLSSARSTLKLLGAAAVGRVSDRVGTVEGDGGRRRPSPARIACLKVGCAAAGLALVAQYQSTTLRGLWWSLLPEALEQNVHLFKAALGEYQASSRDITAADRAASAGSLGASLGLSIMVGPYLGSILTYQQATGLALVFLVAAASLVGRLPVVEGPSPTSAATPEAPSATKRQFWSFLDVPSARSPPALFLLLCRLVSTLAFHIFQTVLPLSLRDRFAFGPTEYGRFFSGVGLFFAASQGVLAPWCLRQLGEDPRRRAQLLVVCSFVVTVTRYWGYLATDVLAVHAAFAVMVTAYGVMSTVIAADTAQIAPPNELGSFYGLVAAVESGAGMVGPLVAGALRAVTSSSSSPGMDASTSTSSLWGLWSHSVPPSLWAVMILNGIGTLLLAGGYERLVLSHRGTAGQRPPSPTTKDKTKEE